MPLPQTPEQQAVSVLKEILKKLEEILQEMRLQDSGKKK